MKFSRLRLHGFKSFCDPVELNLEPGLSGIVGPNGCGKSNLVDALRWVMGESSYKAMRAGGMDDVIFAGAGHRPGRNAAEVTLVLDNGDRTAPAVLNTADVLEITRRIEREAGSVYRVNGREVRARDVQLLFADASTGAHSPALVSQGQIGELIGAKPVQRRALLEEAAGISGLYSRRHEAELRLSGAEQNLERVDDIIAQVETQLETLKRQARLAIRYRALSGDIRKTEAGLYHVRWVAARFAERECEAEQAKLVRALADAQHGELETQKATFLADKALAPLREAEAASGAALQRLVIAGEQLEAEARRTEARQQELDARLGQLEADVERETGLEAESALALATGAEEAKALERDIEGADAALATARAAVTTLAADVGVAAQQARAAGDELAEIRARKAQAQRGLDDAARRIDRLRTQIAEVAADISRLNEGGNEQSALADARALVAKAQAGAADAEAGAISAEAAAGQAQQAADDARPRLAHFDQALSGLESEAATLGRILAHGEGRGWPGIVDALHVTPGYETALGAALGDDLDAPVDANAPLHWAGPLTGTGDEPLPQGAVALSRFVSGSAILTRRLAQIGLIEAEDGPQLHQCLSPGQVLVTKSGALWRWDGFVAGADAPSAAAERLAQRNRLADLETEIGALSAERDRCKAGLDEIGAALNDARRIEAERREAWRVAQREIGVAQAGLDRVQRAASDVIARRSALEEARVRLASSLDEAEAIKADAAKARDEAGADEAPSAVAAAKQLALQDAERKAEEARVSLANVEAAARMRATRLAQIATERAGWQRRQESAATQLHTLTARSRELSTQLAGLEASPQSFAARGEALGEETARAETLHKERRDQLARAETGFRDADRAQKQAAQALSEARENLARMEERLKGLSAQRLQIERACRENLEIEANRTAAIAGIRPADALPQEAQLEHRLDRLKAERERLGGVNLSAEAEAAEVADKRDTMVRDRDDLISAIAKLRTGIQSLNKEGRTRLSEAFDKVNGHFQELFTSLFGGGTAELAFVDSDDPLEAGLEIIARPPGKKPATMTLLSGGEQALIAMSLIFAVFLTNPAPVCVLDEVDAPLDDANVDRFCTLLTTMRQRTQTRFMVITHNPITMSRVDRLFGVTMPERGVSQLVSVDLTTAESYRDVG